MWTLSQSDLSQISIRIGFTESSQNLLSVTLGRKVIIKVIIKTIIIMLSLISTSTNKIEMKVRIFVVFILVQYKCFPLVCTVSVLYYYLCPQLYLVVCHLLINLVLCN